MSLIDGDETHFHVAEFRLEEFGGQSFWRDIQQFDIAEDTILKGDDNLFVCQT